MDNLKQTCIFVIYNIQIHKQFYKKQNKTIMKKIAFVLFASATLFLASCTNGAEKTETTTTDSTAVATVDSTAKTTDTTATAVKVDTTKAVK